jgi:rhomboid protease GluP
MTFESLVPWLLVSTLLALLLRRTANRAAVTLSWLLINALATGVAVAGAAVDRPPAVWAGAALWVVLIVLPMRLSVAVMRRDTARDYAGARRLAGVVSLLHPFDGWSSTPRFYAAMAQAVAGNFTQARDGLRALRDDTRAPLEMRLRAAGEYARISGDWVGLLSGLDALEARARTGTERAHAMSLRVRGLGESGRLDDMVRAFATLRTMPIAPGVASMAILNGAMFVAVFSGRRAMAERVAASYGQSMPAESVRYWTAVADLARGGPTADAAREALAGLARTTHLADLAHVSELRLRTPPAPAADLDAGSNAILDEAEATLSQLPAAPLAAPRRFSLRRARATLLLILINIVVFGVEVWRGGSTDGDTLYALGAMLPDAVTQGGEWWRLGAALFLHAGAAHIGANMLALAIVGPLIEQRHGALRFLFAYFAAGLGSMASIIVFVHWGWVSQDIFVGASGAIMGLFGLYAVALWRTGRGLAGWRQQFIALLAALGLQVAFDLSHPEVSFAAHAGGLLIGIVVALVYAAAERRRR